MDSTILIVDDDRAIKDSMREYLVMAGFTAYAVASAEEALELLKQKKITVVISDISLPGMDGLELTDIIKKNYDCNIIVMTGYSVNYSYEEAVNKGANDFVFKPVRYGELLLRLKRVLRERKLAQERDKMMEKLQKLAITDGLTQLYNSRYFYYQLEIEVGRSWRYNHHLALLMLDMDYFKQFNDTYGHLEGDKALASVAKIIKSCLRGIDTAYRYGGEEFAVILPETNAEEAKNVAERITESIKDEKFSPDNNKVILTISVGVTEYVHDEKIYSFVQRADKALYHSKSSGRNCVSLLYAADLD